LGDRILFILIMCPYSDKLSLRRHIEFVTIILRTVSFIRCLFVRVIGLENPLLRHCNNTSDAYVCRCTYAWRCVQ